MLLNLKTLRKKAGISQQVLADAIGVSQQSINQYENHQIEPDIATLCSMANYFHTSIDFLVGRNGHQDEAEEKIEYHLSKKEAEIMNRYRVLKEKEKNCIDILLNVLMDK